MSLPAFDPGSVRVRFSCRAGRAHDVSVDVRRPTAATILRGRNADEAARLLPMLYAICGTAQGIAARLAVAAARGDACTPHVDATALAEAQRENLWRLLLDWPQALGLARQEALFVEARKAIKEGSLAAWLDSPAWRDHGARLDEALELLPEQSALPLTMLPLLDAAGTASLWPRLDAAFAAAPTFRGEPAGTGALARHTGTAPSSPTGSGGAQLIAGSLIAASVRARIADLREPAGLGTVSAVTVAEGVGRAAVETARGLLLHEVTLDGDRVAEYVIVAPTEWNFHPQGVLRRWLEAVELPDEPALRRLAPLAVLACDPCVRFDIDIVDADN